MKICFILEGAYPYVRGGVSSWVDTMIRNLPQYEFVVQTIVPTRKQSGKFKYDFPRNISEIREGFLLDDDFVKKGRKKFRMTAKERDAFRSVVFRENEQWEVLFNFFQEKSPSVNDVLMGIDFFQIVTEFYNENYSRVVFTDFLWTVRSCFLPIFLTLRNDFIKADLYHTISTGYAGLVACCAGYRNKKPIILTEHGIYTREREEEIIRSSWTKGIYKDLWINHFYSLSNCIYDRADKVCALFNRARSTQLEIGCNADKAVVVHNGVDVAQFESLPQKTSTDLNINIGAILRVTPIKDVKSLINAFHAANEKIPELKLFIIGSMDEDTYYYEECLGLIELLGARNIIFTGHVNVRDYLGRMDIIILTSLSEGQPLAILEAMAAAKPCITTNVGDCSDMLHAEDEDERAGIVVPVMNVKRIAEAIETLSTDPLLRKRMGENGRAIVRRDYYVDTMIEEYNKIFQDTYRTYMQNKGFLYETSHGVPADRKPQRVGAGLE